MFTPGRIAFVIFFVICFAAYLIYAYRKDIKKNPGYFKGSFKIILALIGIYFAYYLLTRVIH